MHAQFFCCGFGMKTDQQKFTFLPRVYPVTLSNAIFIDRKNHKKAIESTTQAVSDMKKHNVISRC
jgi:lysophosphatidate acyltransferase